STALPAPPPSKVIGVAIVPSLASTTSVVPAAPVIAMEDTSLAGRVLAAPSALTVMFPPDALTVTTPPDAATAHVVGAGVGDAEGEGDGDGEVDGSGDGLGSGDVDGDGV